MTETKYFYDLENRIKVLEDNHHSMMQALESNNRNITDELTELKAVLVGDGTDNNPGVVSTFQWLKTLRVYAKASWIILAFLAGIFWGLVKLYDTIKEHLTHEGIIK